MNTKLGFSVLNASNEINWPKYVDYDLEFAAKLDKTNAKRHQVWNWFVLFLHNLQYCIKVWSHT